MGDVSRHISEGDPRTELADSFRDFMIQAIKQQETQEIEALRARTKRPPAGYLYKVDGGFLKVLLAEPADDEVLHEDVIMDEQSRPDSYLPNIWVSVVVPPEAYNTKPETEDEVEENAGTLESIVFSAEDLFIRRVFKDGRVERKLSGDEKYVPEVTDFDTAEALLSYAPPSAQEQIVEASDVLQDLVRYDIRTIRSTQREVA